MSHTRTKVLHLITKSTWGGAQRYVEDIATHLEPTHFDVVVGVGGDGPLISVLEAKGVRVRTLHHLQRNVGVFGELRAFFEIVKCIKKEKPDVLHIHSSKAGLLGSLAGRLCGVPRIVFTAHGWAFNEDRPLWQKRSIFILHALTVLLAHVTVTVSQSMRGQMRFPFMRKKMVTIYPGRETLTMLTKDNARGVIERYVENAETRLIDYHDDLWIGTIAELHPTKQLNVAIDAVDSLRHEFPTLRFIIIHDGELRASLEAYVMERNLEAHIFFTGTIENAARLLPAFDVFVLPSKSEAFGYVLVEAGQAGLPVVATRVGGIPEIIENHKTGLLVESGDREGFTQALRALLSDSRMRQELGTAHQKRVEQFSLDEMLRKIRALYTTPPQE